MLTIHKTIGGKMHKLNAIEDGCWINLTYPSEDELNTVISALGVDPSFLRAALDEEDSSRIESEDGQTLIIIDMPSVEQESAVAYSTLPLGILITENNIINERRKEFFADGEDFFNMKRLQLDIAIPGGNFAGTDDATYTMPIPQSVEDNYRQ